MEKIVALALCGIGVAVFMALQKANARDRRRMAEILGLTLLNKGPQERGEDSVLGRFHQTALMSGTMLGLPATVWLRSVRRFTPKNSRNQSLVTALAFEMATPVAVPFRIEPAQTGRLLAWWGRGGTAHPTGHASFDELFRVSSQDAAVVRLLDETLRGRLMELRRQVAPEMPSNKLGQWAGDLLLGVFEVESRRASYTVMGTPTEKVARHLQAAAPVLADLVRATSTRR